MCFMSVCKDLTDWLSEGVQLLTVRRRGPDANTGSTAEKVEPHSAFAATLRDVIWQCAAASISFQRCKILIKRTAV